MPRRKKKHHHRRVVTRPAKSHRNKVLNRDLDAAYNRFAGSTLSKVLQDLEEMAQESSLAQGYLLALRTEIVNRRAKKHKGDMSQRLYKQKVECLNQLISHAQMYNYRIERSPTTDVAGPADVLYCYLPECEQISWHCHLGSLPLPHATQEWDEQKFSTLNKLERAIQAIFYPASVSNHL